jgi:hypothetical protein
MGKDLGLNKYINMDSITAWNLLMICDSSLVWDPDYVIEHDDGFYFKCKTCGSINLPNDDELAQGFECRICGGAIELPGDINLVGLVDENNDQDF